MQVHWSDFCLGRKDLKNNNDSAKTPELVAEPINSH